MKKIILGCTLMLCGVIGGSGWIIAYVLRLGLTTATDPYGSVMKCFHEMGRSSDIYIAIIFYIIAVIGLGIAVYSFKDSNKHSKTVDEERKQENITGE